jgi:PTS system nitrogen regulatory IIA component
MKLTDILVGDACLVELKARTKKDAVRELAEALANSVEGLDGPELIQLLLERERLGSTAMGDGIAIPHARIETLDRLVAGFGRSRGGVDFDSLDGKPTYLFFLLVAPGREGSAHLLTLARLSRFLTNPAFRDKLQHLEAADDLFRAVEEEESRS